MSTHPHPHPRIALVPGECFPPASTPPGSPTPPRPPREPSPLTPDSLADALYARPGELRSIARRHGVSLDELARRSASPELASGIASLRSLAESRASLLLARAKADAAKLLLSLASGAESDETRRKACVDILKADAGSDSNPAPATREDDDLADGAAASLLALLERLGDPARSMITPPPTQPASDEPVPAERADG